MKRFTDLKKKRPLTVVGLMSGTSMDGVDLCVTDVGFHGESVRYVVRAVITEAFPSELRASIKASLSGPTEQVCRTHYDLGRFYAEKTKDFLSLSRIRLIDAVGMHGQTIHHVSGVATLQIGEPSFLAERLGVPVVSDFRARDISLGGTGAPLTPIVDKWIFQKERNAVLCVNLGGIANVTYLPPRVSVEEVIGFDTGPGMALLDEAIMKLTKQRYDQRGRLASGGQPNNDVVDVWMRDEFLTQAPPKSTGRHYFGAEWLDNNVTNLNEWRLDDLLATLSLFTARSLVANCRRFIHYSGIKQVIVSGGGVHHDAVMKMLTQEFSPIQVASSDVFGVNPNTKEALGIAILTAAYFKEISGNIPSATGASRPVVLGKLTT